MMEIERNPDGRWLPMAVPSNRKLSRLGRPEREQYVERQRRQHAEDKDYLKGWRRPAPSTAETVWSLLADELCFDIWEF